MNIIQENHYKYFMHYLQKHQPIWLVKEKELALAGDDGSKYFEDFGEVELNQRGFIYIKSIPAYINIRGMDFTKIFPIIRIKNGIPTRENWYISDNGSGVDGLPLIAPIQNQTLGENDLIIKDIL